MVEAFFDELTYGVCISDAQGNILYLNPAAESLLGISKPQAHGKKLCDLLCGRLAVGGTSECASTCELLRPGSGAAAVTFQGNYGPKEIMAWKDFSIARRSVWKNLRVRCLKAPSSVIGEGKHLTIIQDAVVDAGRK